MALEAPPWHKLLANLKRLDTTKARANLSGNVRRVEQDRANVVLTTYGAPRAVLVTLEDAAILEVVKNDPTILTWAQSVLKTHK